jgi:hypothetical protein
MLDTRLFQKESDSSFLREKINVLEDLIKDVNTTYNKDINEVNDKIDIISRLLTSIILRQRTLEETTPNKKELESLSNRFYAHLRSSKKDLSDAHHQKEKEDSCHWSSWAWGFVIGANVFGISLTLTELMYPGQFFQFLTNTFLSASPLFY